MVRGLLQVAPPQEGIPINHREGVAACGGVCGRRPDGTRRETRLRAIDGGLRLITTEHRGGLSR